MGGSWLAELAMFFAKFQNQMMWSDIPEAGKTACSGGGGGGGGSSGGFCGGGFSTENLHVV